jgi:hypothetical protein
MDTICAKSGLPSYIATISAATTHLGDEFQIYQGQNTHGEECLAGSTVTSEVEATERG